MLCIAVGRWTPGVTCLMISVGASGYSGEQIDSVGVVTCDSVLCIAVYCAGLSLVASLLPHETATNIP